MQNFGFHGGRNRIYRSREDRENDRERTSTSEKQSTGWCFSLGLLNTAGLIGKTVLYGIAAVQPLAIRVSLYLIPTSLGRYTIPSPHVYMLCVYCIYTYNELYIQPSFRVSLFTESSGIHRVQLRHG